MDVYPDERERNRRRFVEWHAALIRDPVARLRYLRRAAGLSVADPPRRSARRGLRLAALLAALMALPTRPVSDASLPLEPQRPAASRPPDETAALPDVWLVERAGEFETYSNGLRVENLFAVANRPRRRLAVPRQPAEGAKLRADPAGIVFHTTESHLAEFEESSNRELKAASLGLLDYVRRRRSYHFVIDRFGRVYRVVAEADAANHAGWSVWADGDWIYLNLNESFLAVAFEAKHRAGGAKPSINDAQIHAGRVLTDMLRARHRIPAHNCVTHAQVSVNPGNRRIGYHTDWAANFPFRQMGLPDNYGQPLASVVLFGFGFDPPLNDSGEPGLWRGLRAAEAEIQREAAGRGMPSERYRAVLQRRYRELAAALESPNTEREID